MNADSSTDPSSSDDSGTDAKSDAIGSELEEENITIRMNDAAGTHWSVYNHFKSKYNIN